MATTHYIDLLSLMAKLIQCDSTGKSKAVHTLPEVCDYIALDFLIAQWRKRIRPP